MSIWTALEPATISLEPGASGAVRLRLRNDGDRVEEYRLSLVGAPAEWARIEPATLRLYPGTQGQAQVSLSPPRGPRAPAGATPYGVQVRSQNNQALFDVAEGRVMLAPFHDVRAELFPLTARARRTAVTTVTLRNLGNAPLTATLTARDDEDALAVHPNPPVLTVPAGGAATSRLWIRPRRLRLVREAERYPYAAMVVPARPGTAEPGDELALRGTFVRLPLLPRWLLFLLVLLLLLAMAGVIGYAVLRGRGGDQPGRAADAGRAPADTQGARTTAGGGQTGGDQRGQAGEQAGTAVTIVGRREGGLLTVKAGAGSATSVVVAAPARSGPSRDQRWVVLDVGGARVALVSGDPSGAVVLEQREGSDEVRLRTVAGGSAAVGAGRLADRQRWRLRDAGGNTATIINADTGDCLTDRGTDKQAKAAACDDNTNDRQRWTLTPQ